MSFEIWLDNLLSLAGAGNWKIVFHPENTWKVTIQVTGLDGAECVLVQRLIDDKISAPLKMTVLRVAKI